MMSFDDDLLDMMDPSEFGVDAELEDGSFIRGILELNPIVLEDGQTVVSTNTQLLVCRTSDTHSITKGSVLEVEGVEYEVSDKRPDGTGITSLTVHKL